MTALLRMQEPHSSIDYASNVGCSEGDDFYKLTNTNLHPIVELVELRNMENQVKPAA